MFVGMSAVEPFVRDGTVRVLAAAEEALASDAASADYLRERMERLGAEPMSSAVEAFDALYQSDRERWQYVIEANKLRIE